MPTNLEAPRYSRNRRRTFLDGRSRVCELRASKRALIFAPIYSGCCWACYGQLKNDKTVISVTTVQCILYSVYTVFYFFM